MRPGGADTDRAAARQRIRATVDSIPPGRVATYGQVAAEAGLPGRARLVGRVLSELPANSELPWHRVVGAGGAIAQRPGDGPSVQRRRLRAERVRFRPGGRVDLAASGWEPEA